MLQKGFWLFIKVESTHGGHIFICFITDSMSFEIKNLKNVYVSIYRNWFFRNVRNFEMFALTEIFLIDHWQVVFQLICRDWSVPKWMCVFMCVCMCPRVYVGSKEKDRWGAFETESVVEDLQSDMLQAVWPSVPYSFNMISFTCGI